MYRGPIYCTSDVDEVCPWCIHDGSAAAKWDASFNDTYSYPDTVPQSIVKTVAERTPGFVTWQGNHWLFSERDALVFIEEVEGTKLVKEGNAGKIAATMAALAEWWLTDDSNILDVTQAGQPAVYLFHDRSTGGYSAYADMS